MLFFVFEQDSSEEATLREKCPNTEFFLVRIQSECGKIRTRKNSTYRYFSRSATHIKIWITGQQKWLSRQFFCGRSLNALCENCPESELFLVCIFSIRTLYGKIWTRKNSKFGNLSRSDLLHKKKSFLLRLSSVNMTKSAENCGFGHIYWRNPSRKTTFFCAVTVLLCFKIRKLGQTLFLYLFIIIRTSSQTLTYFGFGYKVCIILLGKVLVVTIWKDIFIVLSTRHIQRLEYV